MSVDEIQQGNRRWWTENPMTYDWHATSEVARYSSAWFDEMDARLIWGARLFATDRKPFDRIIPLAQLAGKRVLEIGCGMGLHCETMIRAGAEVTAVDLSPASIEATLKRLELKHLSARVMEADAENLPFESCSFDFVWSWGVIHHSSRTAKIVREIARVIRRSGEARVMVYNRSGVGARVALLKDYVGKFGFLRGSLDQTLYQSTDGFSARYYVPEQFEDLFRAYFRDVTVEVCGQDADVVPLPGALRKFALRLFSEDYLRRAQARRGGFVFLKAQCLL